MKTILFSILATVFSITASDYIPKSNLKKFLSNIKTADNKIQKKYNLENIITSIERINKKNIFKKKSSKYQR